MKLASLVGCLLLSASAIFAQGALGTITGTIIDPSGAVVANAEIEAHNAATGQVYKVVSTDTGNYTVAQLPVGKYDLTITVKGFKTYKRENLDLAAAQIMRMDIPLQVGAQAESVTVTSEASLLKTESGDLTHNVTTTEMSELPILATGGTFSNNTAGYRDPLALARLIPGIQYGANGGFVVNGQPDSVFGAMKSLQIRVEGQTAGDQGFLAGYTAIGQAGTDAIQEVAVQASNYAAEYGAAGAIVNMTMKSGTNQLHGSIYDYAANEILNAAQPYTGVRSPTKRHDYGLTVGGPVILPKIYDGTNKSFFFMSFEEFREDVMVSTIAAGNPTVPTAAYRGGDFSQVVTANGIGGVPQAFKINGQPYVDPLGNSYPSGTIFDPLNFQTVTCGPLPGGVTPNCNPGSTYQVRMPYAKANVIPQANFDPVSLNLLNLVPKSVGPNSVSGQLSQNYQNPFLSQTRSKIPSVKGDQSFGSKTHVSFYGGGTLMDAPYTATNGNAEGFPSPITGARGSFIYTKTYRLNYDYAATPTLLLHLGGGWYQQEFNDDAAATTSYDSSALQTCTNSPTFGGLLDKTCTGGLGPWASANGKSGAIINRQFPFFVVGTTAQAGGMSNLGPFTQGPSKERRPSFTANVTYVKGNHNYKVGGEWRQERYPSTAYTATVGQYTFGANSTMQTALQGVSGTSSGVFGFPFASFLRGDATNFLIAQPGSTTTAKKQMALFIQDTWKVTRKFTLDYGLRWDYATYGREENGLIPNFSTTALNPSADGHPGAAIYEANCNCNFASNYPFAIGPRVGVAYQINSKTVFRGGVGIVYSATVPVGGGAGANSDTTSNPAFGQWVGQLQNGIPTTLHPVFPNLTPNAGQGLGAIVGAPPFLDPGSDRPARQYQWSVGLQREIQKDLVVEVSYVGNRGVWWPASGLTPPLNVLSPALLKQYGFTVGNTSDEALLTQTLGNLNQTQLATLALPVAQGGHGVILPYKDFPLNQTVRQSIYPFPQYVNSFFGSNFAGPNGAPTNAPLGKTWYDSLQVVLTKRFSHGLTMNANYTYSKNLDEMTTPDFFNTNLGKNISANDLPHQFRLSAEYRTPRLRGGNKVVSAILGDWAIGTYLQYQSAPILARPNSFSFNPISNYLDYGPGPAQLKTDANGNRMSPWAINWIDNTGQLHPEPLNVNCRCFDPTRLLVEQVDANGNPNGVFKPGGVLNPNVWSNVPDGQFANDFSVIRDYRGIRYPTENLNVGRSFRIKERVTLNIRVEFANAFNRLQLPQPNAGNGFFQTAGTAITTQTQPGIYQGAITSGFGAITPIAGTSGFRTGLFVGRLTF